MLGIHGGDIYRNQVNMDFSVNVNPLGVPYEVEQALYNAVKLSRKYPDIMADKLKASVSYMLSVDKDYLLFGNGASELFMAMIHAIKPKKTVIPIPSFYGYEYVANAGMGEVIYYQMKEEKDFCLDDDFILTLTDDVELLFLANPNNPTGKLIDRVYLKKVLEHCRDKGILVVLDECFIEFCDGNYSLVSEIEAFDNLIIIRAFTKIFAIPGVRLGYLICSNRMILKEVARHLPEWNISVFAQHAGCACATQGDFIKNTVEYVKKERIFLTESLRQMGYKVYDGKANFILLKSEKNLYELLLKKQILIRDCANYRGLSKGYYRIAVKCHKDNENLLKAIGELK